MQRLKNKLKEFKKIKIPNKRRLAHKFIDISLLISTVLMIWKVFIICSNTDIPILIMYDDSMKPAFYRGDILFIEMWNSPPLEAGDIIVYNFEGKEAPLVRRIINYHEEDNDYYLVTKGDDISVNDRLLWWGRNWIQKKDVVGRVYFWVPFLGKFVIWLCDYPILKYVLIGLMTIIIGLPARQSKN